MFFTQIQIVLITLIFLLSSVVNEFCEDEEFHASCNQNEAVVINSASYGRMQTGRCVTRNYGHIGCSVDVTSELDQHCSGQNECHVDVGQLMKSDKKPCPRDFRSYLLASYICIPGKKLCL